MAQYEQYTFLPAFEARTDLSVYGDNALLLFALALRQEIDDIKAVADRALTDHPEDKKCDLAYVDTDSGIAVIAQGYFAKVLKQSAKTQKAQDLNTAVSWLLNRSLSDLPEKLRPVATELRSALGEGKISRLEVWYVHNLPESVNVQDELASVAETAKNALTSRYPGHAVDVVALEIGLDTLEDLYRRLQSAILVTATFIVDVPGGFRQSAEKWDAFVTSVPARWLYGIYKEHKDDLFSVNLRGYLGSRQSDANINNGIKQSAKESADDFWAFNNGMTALVNSFRPYEVDGKVKVEIKGISIANGAQTTGAIGSLTEAPDDKAFVPARFIKCSDQNTIDEIIRFNNSQNKIEAADFRSTDNTQNRLRKEFEVFPGVDYSGGRRGGAEDIIRRRPNALSSYTAAQALTAFHGNAVLAYNGKSEIWKSDTAYSRIFNDETHADHLLFTYSLLEAISDIKIGLMARDKAKETLTESDVGKLSFLRTRGANYLLVAAISKSIETVLGTPVTSKFNLRFKPNVPYNRYKETWRPIIQSSMAFYNQLRKPLISNLKNADEVAEGIDLMQSLIDSTREANNNVYAGFAAEVLSNQRTA